MNQIYSTLNYDLGEDIDMLRDTVARFAAEEIAPRAAEIDSSNEFPMDLWTKFGDLGLLKVSPSQKLLAVATWVISPM